MMVRRLWHVQYTKQVGGFLDDADPVVEHAIRKDLKKLQTRGLKASQSNLVSHLEGSVWYVRTNISAGAYRTFYFRDGKRSFLAFYAFKKETTSIPPHVRETVMQRYAAITEEDE